MAAAWKLAIVAAAAVVAVLVTHKSDTPAQKAITILSDFKWGVDEAGTFGNLPAGDVKIVDDAVQVAIDTVNAHPTTAKDAITTAIAAIRHDVTDVTSIEPFLDAAAALVPNL